MMDAAFFETLAGITGDSVKLYALMTPPAVLSAFISNTKHYTTRQKRLTALKTSTAIFILGCALYIWGIHLFELFGFTLDAFRIGSGVLLLLLAISLMREEDQAENMELEGDISVVPLAIPLGMGPASIGAVMVMGASADTDLKLISGVISLFISACGILILLLLADAIGKILHATGIAVLSKLTGLLLAAIAAQVIFTGVVGFLA